jgi:UDP-glucose 4-epimerase
MKKVLVTGGAGFIGRALLREIVSQPAREITVVDNLSSCTLDEDSPINIYGGIKFIESDLEDFLLSNKESFDEIYHLASPVGPVGVLKYKGRIAHTIIDHLYNVAMLAINSNAKLCYVSTSEIYGQNPIFDQPEDIDKIVPSKYTVRLEYGIAKLTGEIMLANLSKVYPNFKYFVIRPFNIVGPDQNAGLGFVIPRFIKQALAGEPITVYGDGTDKRTFTDVRDITRLMAAIMDSNLCNTFNVGNPDNVITIGELARLIKKMTDSSSEIQFIDPKVLWGKDFEEAWNKIPNIDRLKSLVGDWPKRKLVDTIDEILPEEYFKARK